MACPINFMPGLLQGAEHVQLVNSSKYNLEQQLSLES